MNPELCLAFLFATQLASAVGHGVRYLMEPQENRKAIALAGALLYYTTSGLLFLALLVPDSHAIQVAGHAAVWVAILGPCAGIVSVLASGGRLDPPQVFMGFTQFCGVGLAVQYLAGL